MSRSMHRRYFYRFADFYRVILEVFRSEKNMRMDGSVGIDWIFVVSKNIAEKAYKSMLYDDDNDHNRDKLIICRIYYKKERIH